MFIPIPTYTCDKCKQKIDKYWQIDMNLFQAKHVDFKLCSICATKLVHFIKEGDENNVNRGND